MMLDGSIHIEEVPELITDCRDETLEGYEIVRTLDEPSQESHRSDQTSSTGAESSNSSPWKRLMTAWLKLREGSAKDIGWLQREPGLPPVVDKTDRFSSLVTRIVSGVHTLPDSFTYLLVPGLYSNHGPLYFSETKRHFCTLGLHCHIAKIHSEASVEENAGEVASFIEELYSGLKKKVIICGHSKGGMDGAAAIAMHWDSLKDKVGGIVLMQSPYGGSPVASDLLRVGQLGDSVSRTVLGLLMDKLLQGDLTALDDLTYERRRDFLKKNPLPEGFPCVCFHSEASKRWAETLPNFAHVAHTEAPWLISKMMDSTAEKNVEAGKLPIVVPLSTVMAACALWLDLRYGEESDGMVTRKDAEVPGSVVVRPTKKLDHGWMVYSPLKQDPKEVSGAQMCEALITLLLETFPDIQG